MSYNNDIGIILRQAKGAEKYAMYSETKKQGNFLVNCLIVYMITNLSRK